MYREVIEGKHKGCDTYMAQSDVDAAYTVIFVPAMPASISVTPLCCSVPCLWDLPLAECLEYSSNTSE
jgi:hypothetical protein